jgi:hypothetical protein
MPLLSATPRSKPPPKTIGSGTTLGSMTTQVSDQLRAIIAINAGHKNVVLLWATVVSQVVTVVSWNRCWLAIFCGL